MNDFFVDPAGMTQLYNQVRGIANDAGAAEQYVRKYADISFGQEGLIFDLVGPHNHAYAVVHGAMAKLELITQRTGTAINASQLAYARTDQAQAARLDALRPGARDAKALRTDLGTARPGQPFTDVADPTPHLRDADWVDGGVAFEFDWFSDVLSPSAWIRWGVYEACGVDPFEWMLTWISGDWAAYRTCGTAWSHVGKACPDFAANLTKSASDTERVWRGNAAAGCQELLVALGKATAGFQATCDTLSKNYVAATEAAKQLYEALTGVAGEIVDAAILFIAATAAGTALIETVVGAIAGYAAAAYYAGLIVALVGEASALYGRAKAVVAAIVAVVETVNANELESIEAPEEGTD
ncbi:hypothetical protein [Actinophytocola sediminis]